MLGKMLLTQRPSSVAAAISSPTRRTPEAAPMSFTVAAYQPRGEDGNAQNVLLVGQGQVPLAVNALLAAIPGDGGLQPVFPVVVYGLLHVYLGIGRRVFDPLVVAGGEEHSVAAHGVANLGDFLERHRVGPQVFHPDALALAGLGQLFAQFVAVGTHHVIDVGSYEPRQQGMDVVYVLWRRWRRDTIRPRNWRRCCSS